MMMIKSSYSRPLSSWASRLTSVRLFSQPLSEIMETSTSTAETPVAAEVKKEEGFVPLYKRLSGLGGAPSGSVFKTMNKWVREGRPTKAEQLVKYVKDLRKFRRYRHALELMDWMVKVKGMNLSLGNHAIRIDLMSKVKGVESAEDYFSKLPENAKKHLTYGALLSCYCAEKKLDKAVALYEKMKELNFASNNLVYSNLMSLYMKLEQAEKVPVLFEEMKANNVEPDHVTYCILMNSYASVDDMSSVEKIASEMDPKKVRWPVYSTLAWIFISAGDFVKAESALKKLEGLVDSRDRDPFHFLISLYARTGNLEEVNRVWKSMKTTFVKLTNMDFLTMLQALNKLDDIEGLRECYEEWEKTYVNYDARLTNTVLSGYLRKDKIEEAESFYAKTKEKEGDLDSRTYDLFIDYCLKKNDKDSALNWLEVGSQVVKVKQADWKLDLEKISLFLQQFEEAKDVDGLEKFCKILKKLNCLGLSAYESLIHAYAAAGRSDPSLRKQIEEAEIQLSPETQELLDEVCASK